MGDKILFKLQPYRQLTIADRRHQKLLSKYCEPFSVLQRIGSVAYKLALPPDYRLHLMFHVSNLKKFYAGQDVNVSPLPLSPPEIFAHQSLAILDSRA